MRVLIIISPGTIELTIVRSWPQRPMDSTIVRSDYNGDGSNYILLTYRLSQTMKVDETTAARHRDAAPCAHPGGEVPRFARFHLPPQWGLGPGISATAIEWSDEQPRPAAS
jgi:hypothetical protein